MPSYWSDHPRTPLQPHLRAAAARSLYELMARGLSGPDGSGIRNGADVLLKSLFVLLGGRHGLTIFAVVLLGTGVVLVWRDRRKNGPIEGRYFLGMAGGVRAVRGPLRCGDEPAHDAGAAAGRRRWRSVRSRSRSYPPRSWFPLVRESTRNCCSGSDRGGAGSAGDRWGSAGNRFQRESFATLLGALIFSAFHYIGPLGDSLELTSFTFRTIAGVLLSALFLAPGLRHRGLDPRVVRCRADGGAVVESLESGVGVESQGS